MTIETKNSAPSSAEILNYATAFGIALALGILAMSIGLIRSETAGDLRTLTATGASSFTRRELTAATAFALALGGAVLGTVAAYVAAIGYAWANPLDGLSELSNVPTKQLLFILVGMPVVAAVIGWLMAGGSRSSSPGSRWSKAVLARGGDLPGPPCFSWGDPSPPDPPCGLLT